MNVASSWKCFCLVVLFGYGYIFRLTDCITISDVYVDGKAEFTCVISPYTGSQIWSINSDTLAFCGVIVCSTESTDPLRYKFTHNVGTGTFIFKIDPTKPTDHNKIVGCFDGTETKSLPIILPDKDQNNSSITNTTSKAVNIPIEKGVGLCGTLCIVLICVAIVLIIFLLIIIHYCVRPKLTNIKLEDTKIHLEWTDRLNLCCCCQRIFGYNIVRKPTQILVKDKNYRDNYTKEIRCKLENLNPLAYYEISLSRTLGCCKSLATKRSVITRKKGMPKEDQECHAKPTSIDVRWTKPDCISNPQLKYKVTCNEEVKTERTDQTNITIEHLIPSEMYKIEVFAIDKGTDSLLLATKISTTPINVKLEDVRYEPGESSVKCHIKWRVENFDIPETFEDFLFNVICHTEEEQIHKKENIIDSSYTIPDLYPDRPYTVDVYAIYLLKRLEPPRTIQITPYIPTWDSEPTPKSKEIELKWKKPEYTGDQQLEYEVVCNREIVAKTPETSYTIENCKPCQKYDIEIFTIINKKNGMKSLPLQRTIRTQPVQHGGNH